MSVTQAVQSLYPTTFSKNSVLRVDPSKAKVAAEYLTKHGVKFRFSRFSSPTLNYVCFNFIFAPQAVVDAHNAKFNGGKSTAKAKAQTVAAKSTSTRPEFQLVEVTNPVGFTSQSNHFIPCGTVYGRLYFTAASQPITEKLGIVIFDSRRSKNSGWHSRSNGNYEIHFIPSNTSIYSNLSNTCETSNLSINGKRTAKLLAKLTASAPPHSRTFVSLAEQKQRLEAKFTASKVAEREVLVALPDHMAEVPTSVQRAETTVVEAVVSIYQYSDYAFMLKYNPSTLRKRICNRFGIISVGVSDADIHAYTIQRLITLNVSPQAIKSIWK